MNKKGVIIGLIALLIITIGAFIYVLLPSTGFKNEPEERKVEWTEAVERLHNGDVAEIYQTHAREVTLVLKNGNRLNTIEPGLDDIFKEVDACGDPCKNIIQATE